MGTNFTAVKGRIPCSSSPPSGVARNGEMWFDIDTKRQAVYYDGAWYMQGSAMTTSTSTSSTSTSTSTSTT